MEEAGSPKDLAEQLSALLQNFTRYIKVGGHYDCIFSKTNGIPQGCSLSLIIANLYVTTLFRMLEDKHEGIKMGAVIDDRNIRHENHEVILKAIDDTIEYDALAGHVPNEESRFFLRFTGQRRGHTGRIFVNG